MRTRTSECWYERIAVPAGEPLSDEVDASAGVVVEVGAAAVKERRSGF